MKIGIAEKDLKIRIYKKKVSFERLFKDGVFIKSYICIVIKKKKWRLERAKCLAHWVLHQMNNGSEPQKKQQQYAK